MTKSDLALSNGGDSTLLTATQAPAKAGGSALKAKVTAPGTLPAPKLSGSRAEYASAYGPGSDLVVTATATGFRQQIVIRQRPAKPVTFRIPLDLPEEFSFGTTGGAKTALFHSTDKGKEMIADISSRLMLDAVAAGPDSGPEEGRVGRAAARVETASGGTTLVLAPDASFLADPAVTYPVTLAAVDSDWWEPTPDQTIDTFVNNAAYTHSLDNQHLDRILVGKSNSGTVRWRSYIRFADIPENDPLRGATVQNADLVLWNHLSNDCGEVVGSGTTVRRITSDWSSNTMTWDDQPPVTSSGAYTNSSAYSPDCTSNQWAAKEWDLVYSINAIAQKWADGEPMYGVQLTAGSESDTTNWRRYRSREYELCELGTACVEHPHQPLLFVDYEPTAEPIQALYVRPRSSDAPTLDEVLDHVDDSVTDEPPDPDAVTVDELESEAEQSPETVGSKLKDAAFPDDLTPEEIAQWSDPNIGEDPAQPAPREPAVAHWLFDEASGTTAADSTINDNGVTLKSGTTWAPGKSGTALSNTPASGQPQSRTSALEEAIKQGKRVEVPEETSESRITYAMPDGRSFTTEVSTRPVRVKRDGTWVPIDTALAEQGGVLRPKALAAGVTVEISTGGTGPFVTSTYADGKTYALSWPTALPKPAVKGGVATFADAARQGADLVVTVLPTGFRHDVVLRERPTDPMELRIGVETGGMTLAEGKGGRLLLKDKSKKLVASAPQPVMWDASARGRLPKAKHARIATEVVTKGGQTELVLKPDHGFLSDPATKYPVQVDPTITLPFNHDVEVSTANDADWPADPTGWYLMAGTQTGGLKSRVHMRFDTGDLAGTTVTDAKLSLLNIDAPSCGTAVGAGIQARRLTSAWDENNLYWANQPTSTTEDALTNTAGINQDCDTWPGPMEWNVTGIAQDWAGGAANHGLVLQSPTETNIDNYRVFPSAEENFDFNFPPTLTVTTSVPASAPTISELTVTPAQDVAGAVVVTSLTPQLAATVSDAAGGTLTGEFEIEHDPAATGQGTGQIWAGSSSSVASGSQAMAAVPAGTLTDGWKVRWRARAVNVATATASSWSAWRQVTVDVPDAPSGPAVNALQVVPSALVGGRITTSSLTPSLRAQVDDPAGGTLRADFEIEHDPAAPQQGSGQIWANSVDDVAAGTQAAVSVPAGTLADGWLVRWRARATSATATSPWSDWQLLTVAPANVGEEPLAAAVTPIIRTDDSFAVAAWVRLDDGNGRYTIAEQRGANAAPFHLGVDPAHGLVFTMRQTDSATGSEEGALSETAPPVGEWFHLAGSYDSASKTLSLYLNGSLIATQEIGFTPWNADGPFTIGTSIKGGIDDLWVFSRGLSAAEVSELHANPGTTANPAATASGAPRAARESAGRLAVNPLPWPVGKSHPIRYETFAECDADVAQVAGFTSFRSRFSGCYSGQVVGVDAEKVNNTLVTKGVITADLTLLIDADQRSRAIVIRAKMDNVVSSGTLLTTAVGLKLKPKGWPDSAHCSPDTDAPFGPSLREKSRASWNANPLENFAMTSTADGASGKDKKSTCRFSLLVKVTPAGSRTRYINIWTKAGLSDLEFKARCDSAKYVYSPSGGCVFTYHKPFMEMARTDVNERGEEWPEQFDHIKKALTNPNASPTYPILGGVVYPHSKDKQKNIPGGSKYDPLHRLVNKDLAEAQRDKSESVCQREIQRTWSSNLEADPLAQNCDEFPFASTEEGSLEANPDYNYSVLLIRADHNQAFGRALGAWFGNNRILKHDAFWIKLS